MSDIFTSYAREDRSSAERLAKALEDQGWSVWWDPKLRAEDYFDDVIEKALNEARCVIVLWSKLSVQSRYVRDESSYALDRDKLVPVAIEEVELPFQFRGIHTPQLIDWDGSEQFPAFVNLVDDVVEKLGQPATTKPASVVRSADEEKSEGVANKEKMTPSKQTSGHGSGKWISATAIVAIEAVVAVVAAFLFMTTFFERKDSNIEIESKADRVSTPISTEVKQAHRVSAGVFRDTLKDGSKGPEMLFISGGDIEMGSDPETDPDARKNEQPRHWVQVRDFKIGKYEVTFDEYDVFSRATDRELPEDSGFGRGKRPVISVSWGDAVKYAEWLSTETGKRYRLPTEAEWEYVARAGSETRYWWGDAIDQDGKVWANCTGCSSQEGVDKTVEVGQLSANDFGLHDTAGNVWEWVQDCWHDSYAGDRRPDDGSVWGKADGGDCSQRVIRGGSWYGKPGWLRSADRVGGFAGDWGNVVGFRLAQDVE